MDLLAMVFAISLAMGHPECMIWGTSKQICDPQEWEVSPVARGTCGVLDEEGRIVAAWPAREDGSCWSEDGPR